MFRRVASALAASAVVLSGLVWGAAPASAIETITASPSAFDDATEPLEVTINGFPTMVVNNYYVYWLDFANMTGTNTGTTCPTFTLVGGPGTALPTGSGSPNPVLPPCEWVSGTKFRFVYQGLTGLNASSQVKITFPGNSFGLPASGQYNVVFTAGGSQEYALDSVCLGNCPVGYEAPQPLQSITLTVDPNGGSCSITEIAGLQGTWTTAPDWRVCRKAGSVFTGFTTGQDGSGAEVRPGGPVYFLTSTRIYAQYVTLRVSSAPTDVVATPGLKKVTVTWKAPSDVGTGPINGYLVQASPGSSSCVTNLASANMLECTYTNLRPGTKYTFAVQALNQAGWSNFSAASNEASPFDLLFDSLSRPEVKFLFISRGSRLEVEGRAPGLDEGATLTPVMQVGAAGAFVPLTRDTTKVDRDGTFSWSRKLDRGDNGKPVSVYFTYTDAKTRTLTAKLGATVGLPSKPRDVKVTSGTDGITVSWRPPAKDGGSPVTEYEMKSDLRAASGARSKFVSCKVAAPTTTCTMRASASVFDPNKTYAFSVVAKTERGTSREATETWKGQIYRLNIFKRARVDSEVLLSFNADGWSNPRQTFEIQAKVGPDGTWKKQGTARLDPDYVQPIADWAGMLPKSVTGGSEVFYRVKSDKGFSNEVRFRLSSSFEYSFG